MAKRFLKLFAAAGVVTLIASCTVSTKNVGYAVLKASKPRLIVMLPPLNESPNVGATHGMLSQVTVSLAKADYYVLPVALVDKTLRRNGLNTAGNVHDVPVTKPHNIFGADAAPYITVMQYGSKYVVVNSSAVVSIDTKPVDLKSGQTLQTGRVSVSNNEGGNSSGDGLIGMLVSMTVNQITTNITDQGYGVAGTINARLLSAGQLDGLLYSPRSPRYGTD